MSNDIRKAFNDSLRSLDMAIGSSKHGENIDFNRTGDMTLFEEVTAPVPQSFLSKTNLDETSAVLLAQDDPGVTALQILFSEFINIYVKYSSDAEIWDEILAYEEICTKQVELLWKVTRKVPIHDANFAKTKEMVVKMVGERNTWRLLRSLLIERQRDEDSFTNDRPMIDTTKHRNDKEIISQLYESSAFVREAQNVVDWLERNAKDVSKNLDYDGVDYFGQTHFAWENTLRAKKNEKENNVTRNNRLVTSLDPDAPLRQDKKLHELDEEEDSRLLQSLFYLIRTGNVQEAQELCVKSGQHWRAATLEGWKLYCDSNRNDRLQRNPVQGNRYRDIWKSVAWKAASDSKLLSVERAVYGSMCGHLPSMLLVCTSWEDQLWASYRTLVDQRVEETLRDCSLHLRPLQPLPKDYPEEKLTPEAIFKSIENRIGSQKLSFHHQLQKHLILNDIDGLVKMSHEVLTHGGLSSHLLRCLTHLVLILKRLGAISYDLDSEITDIVHACVKEAIERGDIEQVARYCAVLPDLLQTRSYADFLVNISEEHHRKHALNMAAMVHLDVPAITATVVAKIRLTGVDGSVALASETSAEDKIKIDAIDWLLYDDVQRPEALRQANALIRSFLINRKINAAKSLFKKIPSDTIDMIIKQQKQKTGSTELPNYYDNRVREYLCCKAFLDAQESFTDWFNHFHQKKPNQPEKPSPNCTFQEQLSFDHRLQQYNAEHDKWKNSLDLITRKACERLHNVLLFPDGGWLVDVTLSHVTEHDDASFWDPEEQEPPQDMAPEDKRLIEYLGPETASREPNRAHQMSTLRAIYIPQVTSLLQHVFHCTENYQECVQLADLIASEQHCLYKCFNSGEMQRFLFKLQETSRQLLDQNCDALGYPQR